MPGDRVWPDGVIGSVLQVTGHIFLHLCLPVDYKNGKVPSFGKDVAATGPVAPRSRPEAA